MISFYSHARVALKQGLLSLNIKPGDKVLVPSYICDSVLMPLRELEVNIVFYSLDNDFRPMWIEIEEKVHQTHFFAILMVHFFGIPQNIKDFEEFCKINNVFLIDDNAHGYGGRSNSKLLGTFGDIGIASPRKVLNLPYGGILYASNKIEEPVRLDRKKVFCGYYLSKNLFSYFPILKIIILLLLNRFPNFNDPCLSSEKEVNDNLADKFSEKILNESIKSKELERIKDRQQERWTKCNNLIQELGFMPFLADIDSYVSPWLFPVKISSEEEKKRLIKCSIKYGFVLSPWPILPSEVIKAKGDAYLKWFQFSFIHLNYRFK